MITGIGTPNNQSKIPLPIAKPPRFLSAGQRGDGDRGPSKTAGLGRSAGDETYQWPVLGIEDQGSAAGFGSPFCNSSIECRSGERTKAMLPSRGGRLMVIPIFISLSQVASMSSTS